MGSELKICKQSACSRCSVSKTEHISEQHKVAAEKNRIKVSTFIQLNPKPPSSFRSAATVAQFTIWSIILTKLLEQGVGHAFLFSQEGLKNVREKFDVGLALIMNTRPLADLLPDCVTQGLIFSREQRTARAETLIPLLPEGNTKFF